ncbi:MULTISPECIES: substrate-binding domain-containing protein [unclassified Sphingobium]|uniref:substrate-binding domain-containing protein n=1 Tax=unclassified Sphingobium TaxID=2611147 RepID=UPI0035A585FD
MQAAGGSRGARIGVVYPNGTGGFISEFLAGAYEAAASSGIRLHFLEMEQPAGLDEPAVAEFAAASRGGALLAPPFGDNADLMSFFAQAGCVTAVVGAYNPAATISCRINDREASYDLTRSLLALGHRNFGFIAGNPYQAASAERMLGFYDAIREVGGANVQLCQGDFTYGSGLSAGERLLSMDCPPTAIVASNDDMAAAVVSVAHRRGLNVPLDVSIVGFDDTSTAVTLWPALTTVRQPVRTMAAATLRMMLELQLTPGEGNQEHIFAHRIVHRASTGSPASPKKNRSS